MSMQSYAGRVRTHVDVETQADAVTAWWELCATLAFLVDVTGHRPNGRGLTEEGEGIPLPSGESDIGERHVRAAVLARCRELATAISPDHVIWLRQNGEKQAS